MHRQSVQSSSLLSVGYDEEEAVLEAEFASGAVYRYRDVPEDLYIRFLAAESKGRFFNRHIREAFTSHRVR